MNAVRYGITKLSIIIYFYILFIYFYIVYLFLYIIYSYVSARAPLHSPPYSLIFGYVLLALGRYLNFRIDGCSEWKRRPTRRAEVSVRGKWNTKHFGIVNWAFLRVSAKFLRPVSFSAVYQEPGFSASLISSHLCSLNRFSQITRMECWYRCVQNIKYFRYNWPNKTRFSRWVLFCRFVGSEPTLPKV